MVTTRTLRDHGTTASLAKMPSAHTAPGCCERGMPTTKGHGDEGECPQQSALEFGYLSLLKGQSSCLSGKESTDDRETAIPEMMRTQRRGTCPPSRATWPDLGFWPAVLFGKRYQKADGSSQKSHRNRGEGKATRKNSVSREVIQSSPGEKPLKFHAHHRKCNSFLLAKYMSQVPHKRCHF